MMIWTSLQPATGWLQMKALRCGRSPPAGEPRVGVVLSRPSLCNNTGSEDVEVREGIGAHIPSAVRWDFSSLLAVLAMPASASVVFS